MYIFSMNNKSDIKKLWDDMLNMKVLLLLNVHSLWYYMTKSISLYIHPRDESSPALFTRVTVTRVNNGGE